MTKKILVEFGRLLRNIGISVPNHTASHKENIVISFF